MTHEQLVEKVARAIHNEEWGDDWWRSDATSASEKDNYRACAKSAIAAIYEAMREPSAKMLDAAVYQLGLSCGYEYWQAMLEASPLKGE